MTFLRSRWWWQCNGHTARYRRKADHRQRMCALVDDLSHNLSFYQRPPDQTKFYSWSNRFQQLDIPPCFACFITLSTYTMYAQQELSCVSVCVSVHRAVHAITSETKDTIVLSIKFEANVCLDWKLECFLTYLGKDSYFVLMCDIHAMFHTLSVIRLLTYVMQEW